MNSPGQFDGKPVGTPMDAKSAKAAGVVKRNRSRSWNRVIDGQQRFGRLRTDAADGVDEAVDDLRRRVVILVCRRIRYKVIAKRIGISTDVVTALWSTASADLIAAVRRELAERAKRNAPERQRRLENKARRQLAEAQRVENERRFNDKVRKKAAKFQLAASPKVDK